MSTQEYNTKEAVAALAEPDPEYAELAKAGAIPKIDWKDIPAIRQLMTTVGDQFYDLFKISDVSDYLQKIPMRDGFDAETYIVKPNTPPSGGSPLIVLCFGGGFVTGNSKTMVVNGRALANLYGATVVCVAYRLSPENKFPAAPNDVWDTLKWTVSNAGTLGADPAKGFILGGISAGAALTAVTAQQWVSQKASPALTGIWLSVPSTLTEAVVPADYKDLFFSREQNANADIIGTADIDLLVEYAKADTSSPLWSPFNAQNPHVGMPPAYFQVDGLDPLRDDGLIYEKVLRANGVKTRIDVYPGLPHAHWAFVPLPEKAMQVSVDIVEGFAWLLNKEAPSRETIVKVFTPTP